MTLDNDTRGWIMTCVSGIACVLGSSIICVDIIIRQFPGHHNFAIADSNAFLSASLSLSFGVMLFSSLYSMLPTSKQYLVEGGYSPKRASYLLIGLFLLGVIAIQVLSRFLHHHMPSHVVDCDHTHEEEAATGEMEEHHHRQEEPGSDLWQTMDHENLGNSDEETPLLSRERSHSPLQSAQHTSGQPETSQRNPNGFLTAPSTQPISFVPRTLTRTLTALTNSQRSTCDESGPCMGYSSPCGADCFRAASRRGTLLPGILKQPSFPRSRIGTLQRHPTMPVPEVREELSINEPSQDHNTSRDLSTEHGTTTPAQKQSHPPPLSRAKSMTHHYHHAPHENGNGDAKNRRASSITSLAHESHAETHHHHVPTNAFMSIGLQTSIAIALHKLPEGFITYATNHANPTLGLSVFMALFIHNITEGFAMALPLYLALNSRIKAMIWSSFLGGASQPVGAAIAALWFRLAGEGSMKPSDQVYGGMFAVTSGVMTSVALSLFSESLAMTHNRGLCIVFAFAGMGILGFSFALTAK